jgi:hypothetical protein
MPLDSNEFHENSCRKCHNVLKGLNEFHFAILIFLTELSEIRHWRFTHNA